MNTNISEGVPDGRKKKCSELFPLNLTRCRHREVYYERKAGAEEEVAEVLEIRIFFHNIWVLYY